MKKQLIAKAPPAHRILVAITAAVGVMALGGCMMVGPDYARPKSAVSNKLKSRAKQRLSYQGMEVALLFCNILVKWSNNAGCRKATSYHLP